ncbi:hypothetical protein CULT_360022 [[Clostridium] ultunense Esp]|nr:hypothetical protein CULT_360022 [[Clostridium] ultunense Esp]
MSEEKHIIEKGILSEPPFYQASPSDAFRQETFSTDASLYSSQPLYTASYPNPLHLPGYSVSANWSYPSYPVYPIVSPCDVMMVVRPAVKHGLQGMERSINPRKTLNETAMIAYLLGAGFDYRSAEYLVESWEIGDMPFDQETR